VKSSGRIAKLAVGAFRLILSKGAAFLCAKNAALAGAALVPRGDRCHWRNPRRQSSSTPCVVPNGCRNRLNNRESAYRSGVFRSACSLRVFALEARDSDLRLTLNQQEFPDDPITG
jgi:hypothetical protein